jgi:uncharacterized membrane protein
MNDDDHDIFKDEELITVKMRVKDYRRMMTMIERDESMTVVGRYVKTILLSAAAVLTAWLFLWNFLTDKITGQ